MSDPLNPLAVIVLAAGQGTRMKSRRAKVLHELGGKSMLGHVLDTASNVGADRLFVVVGRDADQVQEAFAGRAEFVMQEQQRGTGHAVMQVLPKLEGFRGDVLVLYGDTPLLREESIRALRTLRKEKNADLVMLTSPEQLPGVVVRDGAGRVQKIVELVDANKEERKIQEGNTGVYLMDAGLLRDGLATLKADNSQGELYLTGVVGFAVRKSKRVEAIKLRDASECLGVNTRSELAEAAYVLRTRKIDELLDGGVSIVDPEQTYVDADVKIGRDTLIEPGCVIQGNTVIGEGVHLKPHCHIESSTIGDDAVVGPSAHLRPGTELGKNVRIGNFVEVKASVLGDGVKVDHLSYVGDAEVGEGSSFGCGSITVNYDWNDKHKTIVGKGSKIGCNANLIAPVTIGDGVAVAAGSTIGQNVPDGALGVARAKQRNLDGWMDRKQGRRVRAATAPTAGSGTEKPAAASNKPAAASKPTKNKPIKKKAPAKKKAAKKAPAKKKTAAKKPARKKPAKKKARKKK